MGGSRVDRQAEKKDIVESILENSVVMSDADMMIRIRKVLMRMSLGDLQNFKYIIEIKMQDVFDEIGDTDSESY